MTQALHTLAALAHRRRAVAVLGDMLELGAAADTLHEKIGALAAELEISCLFLFGHQVTSIRKGALENGLALDRIFMGTKEQIARKIGKTLQKGDWVLVKGSRGMAMETLIPAIEQLTPGTKEEER
jgi:UDP-N-acetylmuramyl pentapeptide synthase